MNLLMLLLLAIGWWCAGFLTSGVVLPDSIKYDENYFLEGLIGMPIIAAIVGLCWILYNVEI